MSPPARCCSEARSRSVCRRSRPRAAATTSCRSVPSSPGGPPDGSSSHRGRRGRAVARRRLPGADQAPDHGPRAPDGGGRLRRSGPRVLARRVPALPRRHGPRLQRGLDAQPVLRAGRRRANGPDEPPPDSCGEAPAGRSPQLRSGDLGRGTRPARPGQSADPRARRGFARALRLRLHALEARLVALHGRRRGSRGAAPADGLGRRAGTLGPAGWGLFAILFLWQLPHFLAIGWLYREDYARGGFPMLAVTDRDGASSGRQALLYATALLPVTLAAGMLASAGAGYLWGALILGLGFLGCAAAFAGKRTVGGARRLFLASVLYLPLVLGLMVFDR